MLIDALTTQQVASENIANTIISTINEELERRISLHIYLYSLLWNDATATPQAICDKLMSKGFKPAVLFQLSAMNKANLESMCSLCGKQLSDFISVEYLTPKLPFTINADGSITIGVQSV